MLGIFNRFNPVYEEAARDLGASENTTFWQVVFPLIASSVVGVGLLGFTLSYDKFTRTSLISGETNTLPLEIFGMTTNVTSPALYALGTLTTIFSFLLIGVALLVIQTLSKSQTEQEAITIDNTEVRWCMQENRSSTCKFSVLPNLRWMER